MPSPTDAAVALLPCPFCGASGHQIGLHTMLLFRCWRVQCVCGAEGGPFSPIPDHLPWGTQDQAITAWNTRAPAREGGDQASAQAPAAGVTDTQRLDWLESNQATVQSFKEPREDGSVWVTWWQVRIDGGTVAHPLACPREAIDAAMTGGLAGGGG